MKNLIYSIFVMFFLTNIYAQDQDTIKNYPGIPLITYTGLNWDYVPFIPEDQFKQIDSAGIFALQMANLTQANFVSKVKNTGLLVMPEQVDETVIDSAYIYRYTEGRYTEFEAEGTSLSEGKVTLYNDSLARDIIDGAVVTKPTTLNGTLIYGPMYSQCVHYAAISAGQPILYRAKYSLKLEDISSLHPLPTDTMCILRVTTTRTWDPVTKTWGFWETKKINERAITYQEFFQKGQWLPFDLDYNLQNIPAQFFKVEQPPFNYYKKPVKNIEGIETDRVSVNCIEFKLIWKGNSTQVKLSVDKIVLSDNRGRELYDPLSRAELNIKSQIDQSLIDFEGRVAGWIGLDEPWSLDMWGAIRKVSEIIDSYPNSAKAKLYFQFNPSWNGRFGDYGDVARASKVIMIDEFMRRVKKGNIWVTNWLYDLPCDGIITDAPCNGTEDFRSLNITWAADSIYKKFTDAAKIFPDLHYGISIQTGKYRYSYNGVVESRIREITGQELLYQTNLSLMYGAKLISPWLYFGHYNGVNDDFTGFRNPPDYPITDKYLMLKNTIAPRLKGLFGKTLKTLTPTNQVLNVPLNSLFSNSNFIKSIIKGGCTAQGMQPSNEAYDLGFFKDAQDGAYFMLINRWYSPGCNPSLTVKMKPEYFSNYNLRVVNYINDQTFNTNRYGSISTAPVVGDAGLFGVFPILKYGGSIFVNDTTYNNETLLSYLSIESGATLTINGTYYAKANITVKSGGKVIAGTNAKIIFDSGKKLIVEGITELKGTSILNRLTLQSSGSDNAVLIKPGSSLTMNYCKITGSYTGISTQAGTQSYVNISNSIIEAGYGGISLVASTQFDGFQTPPTPTIQNCSITAGISGVGVSNYSSVLLKSNTFTNCGITVSNVSSAYIQSNNISLGTNTSQPGIFFNNSGGYIRSNTIKNRVNGIHFANSSVDCGGNLIENNYKHGLYIAGNSIPNLVGFVQTNPPTYYPLAGYNTIRNNGNNTEENQFDDNDGSEIYFSYSDAHLGTLSNPGCNQISDDRTATPSMTTIWLLSGVYGNEPHFLDAIYNYWGTLTPTSNRFGIATNFNPYYTVMCSPNGGAEEEKLVLKTSSGEIVDSISSAEGEPENFTALETSYSEADNLFATGNVTQAKPLYEQIVTGNYTTEEKLSAYNKLYAIGNLTGEDETYFTSLQTTFEDIANSEADTLIKKVYEQNAIKCDVSKEEYVTAINKFDNIIQENPNSEEAVYAEIDIITTALNIDTTNPGLGKIGSKYLVKGTSDYLSKLNDILQSKFGVNSEEGKQIIPKEYSLHQNYPNPFNPTTTIKFDIPDVGTGLALSNVTLKVYDILGKEVATLINGQRSPGSYEHQFNASNLASGVYIYKLQAGDFISSKKMILLK